MYVDTTDFENIYMIISFAGTDSDNISFAGPNSRWRFYRFEGEKWIFKNQIQFLNEHLGLGAVRQASSGLMPKWIAVGSNRAIAAVNTTPRHVRIFETEKTPNNFILTTTQNIFPGPNPIQLTGSFNMFWVAYTDFDGSDNALQNNVSLRHRIPDEEVEVIYKHIEHNIITNSMIVEDGGILHMPQHTAGELSSKIDLEDGDMVFDKTNGLLRLWFNNQWSVWSPVSGFGHGNFTGYIPNSGTLSINGEVTNVNAVQLRNHTPAVIENKLYSTNDTLMWDGQVVGTSVSDMRIKKDIEEADFKEDYNIVKDIKVYKYNYIDPVEMHEDKVHGFIAQEVEEFLPEAVRERRGIISDIMATVEIDNGRLEIKEEYEIDAGDQLMIIYRGIGHIANVNFIMENIAHTDLLISGTIKIQGHIIPDRRTLRKDRLMAVLFNTVKKLQIDLEALQETVNNLLGDNPL